MTTPIGNIRLGFSAQRDRTEADVIAFARWAFLQIVADVEPAVLASLDAVADDADEEAALCLWARRWHLTDAWCLAYARATLRAYRTWPTMPRCWVDGGASARWDRPRPGRQAARPKKDPAHVRLLAEFQVCARSYADLAAGARLSPEAVRDAITRTANLIQLTPRPVARGGARRLRS